MCYLQTACVSAGAVAKMGASHKAREYRYLAAEYIFHPAVLKSVGPENSKMWQFLVDLGRRISRILNDDSDISCLFHRFSVLLFRFNFVSLHDDFVSDDFL